GPVEVRIAQFEDAAIKQTINGRCLQIRDFWDADSSLKDKRLCDRFRERNEFRRDTRGLTNDENEVEKCASGAVFHSIEGLPICARCRIGRPCNSGNRASAEGRKRT